MTICNSHDRLFLAEIMLAIICIFLGIMGTFLPFYLFPEELIAENAVKIIQYCIWVMFIFTVGGYMLLLAKLNREIKNDAELSQQRHLKRMSKIRSRV